MPNVIADITMSLDGFVTGVGADEDHGLGDAPELHTGSCSRTRAGTTSSARDGGVRRHQRTFSTTRATSSWRL